MNVQFGTEITHDSNDLIVFKNIYENTTFINYNNRF